MIEIADSEKIIRVVRKHWFVLLGNIFILVFFIAIPAILLFALQLIPLDSIIQFDGNQAFAVAFFFFAWLFVVWMIGWNMWTDFYLDVLLVTDSRIFDIEQHGLFRRTSSSFRIDKIQNVTVDQKGIIETMLDFGTLQLETAGEREDFIAHFIANPYEIKKFINDLQDREEERSRLVHFDSVKEMLVKP
jgi:uncharacterized membrane protein YdbT with pleckstrin-like domain